MIVPGGGLPIEGPACAKKRSVILFFTTMMAHVGLEQQQNKYIQARHPNKCKRHKTLLN